jgi:uncharacterized Zn ribbon protein
MRYCPNCSAYQKDGRAKVCSKCGYDFSDEEERRDKRRREIEEEEFRRITERNADYNGSVPCPVCGSPTREYQEELECPVEGRRIPIRGVKLMGGDITKKPVTMLQFDLKGRICTEGHKIYGDFECREKKLCPVCHDKMVFYGASLLSCPRCNRHFESQYFPDPDPEEELKREGWVPSR